jgi:quercetin dioxygenase-like cupin family protein
MDTKGFIVPPGQGPVWDMSPGRSATLKLQSGHTGKRVMMFEEVAPAGTATVLHIHHSSDEVAYVLSGEITFKIGDQISVGRPGACAFMPRGIAHAWKISGAEVGRILFIFTPAEAGEWFEELERLQRPIASLDDAEVKQLRQRCHFELVGSSPFSGISVTCPDCRTAPCNEEQRQDRRTNA